MADTVSAGLALLNNADLSTLRTKLDRLRADLEAALKQQGKNTNATAADLQAAAAKAGVSVEEFLAALETAKKMGLL